MTNATARIHILYYLTLFFVFAALLTPLIVFPQWFMFPFITSKVFFFRMCSLLALTGTLILLLYYPALRQRITKLHIAWLVYAFAITLSGIFGVDFYRSWWSGHERMLGIFSVLHYIGYAWILTIVLRGWEGEEIQGLKMIGWRTWFIGLGWVSVITAIVGLVQRFGNSALLFVEPGGRVYGTLGNFIYLGNFMVTALWIFALLIIKETRRKRQYLYSIMMAPLFFALLFSGSRGAMFGALAAGVLAAITILFLIHKKLRVKVIVLIVAAITCIVLLYTTPVGKVFGDGGVVARLFSIGTDVTPRFIAWKVAFEAWKEFPIFGWGFENFFIAFNAHFNPQSLEFSFYETWFDSAHNIVLNTLATTGVIGLLAYLGLYGTGIFAVLQLVRSTQMKRGEAITLIGLLFADFGSKLFVFDHPTSYLVLFGVLAYIAHRTFVSSPSIAMQSSRSRFRFLMSASVLLFGLILLFSTNITPLIANAATVRVLQDVRSHPAQALSVIENLMARTTPYLIDVRLDIARDVRLLAPELERVLGREAFITLVKRMIVEIERAHVLSPRDLIIVMAQADLFHLLASRGDTEAYERLQERYKYAFSLSPRRQQLYFLYSRALMEHGESEKAIALVNTAIAINPKVAYSYWLRGVMSAQSGAAIRIAFDDVYRSTQTLGFVPQNIGELEGTSAVYAAAGFPRLNYDFSLVHKYEENGVAVPQYVYERMINTLHTIGLNEFAKEFSARAHAQYKEIPLFVASLNAKNDVQKIQRGIMQYRETGRTPPLDLYYALLFAAHYQNATDIITATRNEMKLYYRPYYEQMHDWVMNCFKEGNSFEVFDECITTVGV